MSYIEFVLNIQYEAYPKEEYNMAIIFKYIDLATDPTKIVGHYCGSPAYVDDLDEYNSARYNWHFQITGITNGNVYPRLLLNPSEAGKWFNPSLDSVRTDSKCNNDGNWPMNVEQTDNLNGTYTWDIYIAPYLDDPRPGEIPLRPFPTTDYTIQLYEETGGADDDPFQDVICRVPGLWFNEVVNTPVYNGSNVVSVGTDCDDPEDNDVSTNWKFTVSGIDQATEAPVSIEEIGAVTTTIWKFNAGQCGQDNYRPLGRDPENSYEPDSDNSLVTWFLYVTPAPNAVPSSNGLYRLAIADATTLDIIRYEDWIDVTPP